MNLGKGLNAVFSSGSLIFFLFGISALISIARYSSGISSDGFSSCFSGMLSKKISFGLFKSSATV